MNIIPRTTPLKYGEEPWDWNTSMVGECTWYCFYRAIQVSGQEPVYRDRAKRENGYNHGKTWIKNYKEDWYPHYFSKEPNLEVKAGDILVFDGNYGHVAFIEKVIDFDHFYISDYNRVAPSSFDYTVWTRGRRLSGNPYGTGDPMGVLRYEPKCVYPVKENKSVDQVYVDEPTLRVRLAPNLQGKYYCNCAKGFFNVLGISEADGYTWYEIEDGKYIANIGWKNGEGVKFIKADNEVERLKAENEKLKTLLNEVNKLTEGF